MKLNKILLAFIMFSTAITMNANASEICEKEQNCPQVKIEKTFHHHKHHHMKHKKHFNLDEKLQLTEEQKSTLKQYRQDSKKKMKPIMKKMVKKKHEIDKIMLSNLSKTKKIEKIEKVKAEMKILKIQADQIRKEDMERFESILTNEQKIKFEEIKKERKKQFAERKNYHNKLKK